MTEAHLTHEIIAALNQIPGVSVWRQNTGRRGGISFGRKGAADITGVLRGGKRIELEVKLPTNNVFEAEQPAFLRQMTELGALCAVVRSVSDATKLVMREIQR